MVRRHGFSAIVVDHPSVVAVARKIVDEAGLTDRIHCVAGDVFTGSWLEGADLILLSYVVSSYGPATDTRRSSMTAPSMANARRPPIRPERSLSGDSRPSRFAASSAA
jgi:O-methyltransferase domain